MIKWYDKKERETYRQRERDLNNWADLVRVNVRGLSWHSRLLSSTDFPHRQIHTSLGDVLHPVCHHSRHLTGAEQSKCLWIIQRTAICSHTTKTKQISQEQYPAFKSQGRYRAFTKFLATKQIFLLFISVLFVMHITTTKFVLAIPNCTQY